MVQNYEKKPMFFCSSIQNFVFLSAICFWGRPSENLIREANN